MGILHTSPLYDEIVEYADQHCPALIVLDTLADLFPGNENDRAQARQFIGILRGLAMRTGAAVLLLAHPSLTGISSGSGLSGSTAWNNSVRSRLYLTRIVSDGYEQDPDARILRVMKANYGPAGDEIPCHWRDGVFVADPGETGVDRMAGGARAERVFLRLLGEMTEQGRRVNASSGPNYAPSVFTSHPDSEGVSKLAFRGAMEALLHRGVVAIAESGPASRRVTYLSEVVK